MAGQPNAEPAPAEEPARPRAKSDGAPGGKAERLKRPKRRRSASRPKPSPAERTIRTARIVGLVLCAGGFVAIYIGWEASSRVTCVDCQLPYLLSAGATGIGLIVLGIGVLLIAEIRAARLGLSERLARLRRVPQSAEGEPAPDERDAVQPDGPMTSAEAGGRAGPT